MERNNRIPAAAGGHFPGWALPEVSDGQLVEVVSRRSSDPAEPAIEESPRSVTAGELEALTQQAWQEGSEQGYRDGHAEGYAAGHDEGLVAGRADARAELERQLGDLREVMAQLLDPIAGQRDAIEAALLRLSLDIARTVLDREPVLPPEQLLPVVREAVRQLPVSERDITVFLHPDQCEQMRASADWPATWRIESDRRLATGGCRVEAGQALVDFSVDLRFRQVVERLLTSADDVPEPGLLLDDGDER